MVPIGGVVPLADAPVPMLGPVPADRIRRAAEKISKAESPVVLLGMGASEPRATAAVRAVLKRHALPVVGTFQGAGAVSRALLPLFFGRVPTSPVLKTNFEDPALNEKIKAPEG
jgi:acetolactate synthase I/II/III large subunit